MRSRLGSLILTLPFLLTLAVAVAPAATASPARGDTSPTGAAAAWLADLSGWLWSRLPFAGGSEGDPPSPVTAASAGVPAEGAGAEPPSAEDGLLSGPYADPTG